MGRRLGILGGTFDPVHLGHLASARDTAGAFDLQRVLLILSARPPHKPSADPAPVGQRLEMLRLACAGDPLFEISEAEARRPGPSYTYDTVEELRRRLPEDELYLILGIDAFLDMDSWHRPAEIFDLCNVIVTSRPGHDRETGPVLPPSPPIAALGSPCYDREIGCYIHSSGHVVAGHRIQGLDISASEIRRRVRARLPVESMTGAAVARYIANHNLYGAPNP